jgi:hypothetical protein
LTAWTSARVYMGAGIRYAFIAAACADSGKTDSTRVRSGVTTSAGALRMYWSAIALTDSGRAAR